MPEREWISMQRKYEGFPLYLRFPRGLNYDTLQKIFPVRVSIEHTFNFRRFDGAPEPRYNEKLENFDVEPSSLFDDEEIGPVVLIETFGGKRTYYFYVAPSAEPEFTFAAFVT